MNDIINYLKTCLVSLAMSSENQSGLLAIFITIAFIVGLFVFVIIGEKKDQAKKAIIDEMLANDPKLRIEYRYFIDLRDTQNGFNYNKFIRSIITIAIYFIIFNFVAAIVSQILASTYISNNNLPEGALTSSSAEYSEEAYNDFLNKYEVLLELIIYGLLCIGVVIPSIPFIKKDFKNFKKKYLLYALMGFGFIIGASVVCSVLISSLGFTGDSGNESSITEMFTSSISNAVILSIVTVILAPIVEELVFRKALFNIFGNKTRLALVVSSLIFGLMHVVNPAFEQILNLLNGTGSLFDLGKEIIYLITYTSMGIAIALTYLKTERNVFGSIVAHMINNFVSLLVTFAALLLDKLM